MVKNMTGFKTGKRIEQDDGYYRVRRGKLVRIPDEWVGRTLHPQHKRNRKEENIRGHKTRKGRGKRR